MGGDLLLVQWCPGFQQTGRDLLRQGLPDHVGKQALVVGSRLVVERDNGLDAVHCVRILLLEPLCVCAAAIVMDISIQIMTTRSKLCFHAPWRHGTYAQQSRRPSTEYPEP